MIAGHWCRECDRSTRMLGDGRRCPQCHPLAGTDPWRPPAWCGECDQRTRLAETVAGVTKCGKCHPMAHPPQRWPTWLVPASWDEQLAACEWMCYISPTLRRIGVDPLRELLRIWFEAQWTPNDILYALDRQPTGELHTGNTPTASHGPEVVKKWLVKRLRLWLDDSGRPLASVHTHVEFSRTQQITRMSESRKRWQAQQAAAALPGTVAALKARSIAVAAAAKSRAGKPGAARRERETATVKAALACAGDSALDQLDKALRQQHP